MKWTVDDIEKFVISVATGEESTPMERLKAAEVLIKLKGLSQEKKRTIGKILMHKPRQRDAKAQG